LLSVDVYNIQGEKTGKLTLPKTVFGVKVNLPLVAQAVRVYLANQRQAPAKTKHRGEVAYSTRKLYRQKGTGRARHGARSAPIFVKGGVAHGPQGKQNYQRKLNQKMKKAALKSALSKKLEDKEIIILTGLEKLTGKTKELAKIIKNLELKVPKEQVGKKTQKKLKISLVLPVLWEKVMRAGANLPFLRLLQARQLNTYEVLNNNLLIFTKESLEVLENNLKRKHENN